MVFAAGSFQHTVSVCSNAAAKHGKIKPAGYDTKCLQEADTVNSEQL